MRVDRPLFGIVLMVGFCATAPMADAFAKVLGDTIPLLQLLLARFSLQAALLFPFILWTGRPLALTRHALQLTILRSFLHVAGLAAMFTALRFLPLADAVAMVFVMPFIMLLLGRLVLNEVVGARRLISCAVGFLGTLLVVQPSFVAVGLPALLPLLVAFIFALFMMVSRQLATQNDPVALQAVSGIASTAMLAPLALFFNAGVPSLEIVVPTGPEFVLLVAVGFLGTAGHLLMTWALRFAPAATLAPIQFLEIPLATAVGWLIFRDLPNDMAAIGIVIITLAGLHVLVAERRQLTPAGTGV